MSKAVDNIEIGPKWGEMTKLLMFLLSFGANPFDTFQVSHKFCGQRGAKLYHIRINLISFIRNRNVNFLNFVIEKGLNLYYQKFIDNIVHLIDVKYNLGRGNDIVQLCNVIVKNYLLGTIEERYQIGKQRFELQKHWIMVDQSFRPNQDVHDTYYPLLYSRYGKGRGSTRYHVTQYQTDV